MKRLKFIAALATALILVHFLQSCLDNNDSDYPFNNSGYPSLAMSTIRTLEEIEHGYYFGLDDGSKMYPGDTTAIHNYLLTDGQRAFVYFDYLNEQKAGYDYNIKVQVIINIPTKDIVNLTNENAETIGDNKINANYMWIAQNYLNIEYQYFGTRNANKKHFLNLVENTISAMGSENGYINLEFRHNAEGDLPNWVETGYVSFKLDKINEKMKDAKGLKIRVNTIYDGVKIYTVDFKEKVKNTLKQPNTSEHTTTNIY